jgi:hypothetical protein
MIPEPENSQIGRYRPAPEIHSQLSLSVPAQK